MELPDELKTSDPERRTRVSGNESKKAESPFKTVVNQVNRAFEEITGIGPEERKKALSDMRREKRRRVYTEHLVIALAYVYTSLLTLAVVVAVELESVTLGGVAWALSVPFVAVCVYHLRRRMF